MTIHLKTFIKMDNIKALMLNALNGNINGCIEDLDTLILNTDFNLTDRLVWMNQKIISFSWIYHHRLGYQSDLEIQKEILNAIINESNVEKRNSLLLLYGGLPLFLQDGGAETEFEAVDSNDDTSAKIVKVKLNNKYEYFILYTNGTRYFKAVIDMTSDERWRKGYNDLGQKIHCESFISVEQFKKFTGIKGNVTMRDITAWTYNKTGLEYSKLVKRT